MNRTCIYFYLQPQYRSFFDGTAPNGQSVKLLYTIQFENINIISTHITSRIMVCTMQHSVKNKITVHKSSKVNKSNVSLPALLLYYEIMRLCSSVINGNYRCELYISALFHNTIDSTFHTIFSDDLIYDFLSKQLHFGRSAVIRVY